MRGLTCGVKAEIERALGLQRCQPRSNHRLPRRHCARAVRGMGRTQGIRIGASLGNRLRALIDPSLEPGIEAHLSMELQCQDIWTLGKGLMRIMP